MTMAIRLAALALLVAFALVAGHPGRPASAETTGSVAIGCEFLFDAIDGDPDDVVQIVDTVDACDGIDATDVSNLAAALGDEDDRLEPSDFVSIDLDANQVTDEGTSISDELYVFAFVDDDDVVTFDAEAGVTVSVNRDTGGPSVDPDVNAETCTAEDDLDCNTNIFNDGDGVVVATITEETADDDDAIDVDLFQADDTSSVSTQTVNVQGLADEVDIAILGKGRIQVSGFASVDDCVDSAEVTDTGQLDDVNRTLVAATVTDNDGDELTRVVVDLSVDDEDIARIDDDAGDRGSDPNGNTGVTVDAGEAGIASFAVVCGGEDTGTATVTATILEGSAGEEDDSVEIEVVGEPANVALTASPAAIGCDGTATSTVTATVTDLDGNNVADGTNVTFSVVALGTANPIADDTVDGVASSRITPLSGAAAGVTVIVSAGDAQASIRIDCAVSPAAIDLIANPPAPRCDGVATSLITATLLDQFGQPLAGAPVHFEVNDIGVVSPANAVSDANGVATTTFRGYSASTVGVPVVVTSGTQQDSIVIFCQGFDTDADGMPNTFEQQHACLDPNVADSNLDPDNDDLMTFAEYGRGSDPCDRDTDDDRARDNVDNCILTPNADQQNTDVAVNAPGDPLGDACDPNDDNDACSDVRETGADPNQGGLRNPLDPWDFYDVNGNATIDLTDTLAILAHFGQAPGGAGYAATYDRSAPDPQQPWRTALATGDDLGIDLADALLNLQSFGHTCA